MKAIALVLLLAYVSGLGYVMSTNFPFCIEVDAKVGDKLFTRAKITVYYSVTGKESSKIEFTVSKYYRD